MFLQTVEPGLIQELWEKFGISGLLFGFLLALLMRQSKKSDKRIEDLEIQQKDAYQANLNNHKEMIEEYVTLVKDKNAVLGKLTACLEAIKNTLDRVERRQEDKT